MINATIPPLRVQIVPTRDKLFRKRWFARIVGKNNEIVWSSELRANKSDVIHICDRTKAFMSQATITVYEKDPRK